MRKAILIPAGCVESHGFLPDDTDTLIAKAFCKSASKKHGTDVAEALSCGFCPSTYRLQGTDGKSFEEVFRGFRKAVDKLIAGGRRYIVFVNIHGGNDAVLRVVVEDTFIRQAFPVMYFNPYTAFARELDGKYFAGKDNNYKEISLLQASLGLLGFNLIKGPRADQAQRRSLLLERLRRRAVVGFFYTEASQHIAWRKDVDAAAGRKYLNEVAGRFGPVLEDFKKYADKLSGK